MRTATKAAFAAPEIWVFHPYSACMTHVAPALCTCCAVYAIALASCSPPAREFPTDNDVYYRPALPSHDDGGNCMDDDFPGPSC